MAGTIKARRVRFLIGDIQMNGYLLPDGRKYPSLTIVEIVGKTLDLY